MLQQITSDHTDGLHWYTLTADEGLADENFDSELLKTLNIMEPRVSFSCEQSEDIGERQAERLLKESRAAQGKLKLAENPNHMASYRISAFGKALLDVVTAKQRRNRDAARAPKRGR